LRERPGDLGPLAERLLARIARQLGRPAFHLDDEARARLAGYPWPGNVRELANVLERAAILSDGSEITAPLLVLGLPAAAPSPPEPAALDGTLEALERQAIRRALQATGGNRKQAAARLGIGLRTLYDKLRAYGIE
jgi:two-component system response regulator FlrC